jgi:6-phosphogluconate dehydrogenase (decarboxylating)
MRIAIIGLGRMGRAFADRLLDDGHEVSVWNRTPGRADSLQERGARVRSRRHRPAFLLAAMREFPFSSTGLAASADDRAARGEQS